MKSTIASPVRLLGSGHEYQKNNIKRKSKNLLILLFATLTLSSCEKDDNPETTNPVSQLPAATQVGANTFGCLLDGEPFKPDNLSNSTNCFYQLVDGEYFFTVRASYKNSNSTSTTLALKTEKKDINQGFTYDLLNPDPNQAYGLFSYGFVYYTSEMHTGKLTITKLTNQIVSGTFYFDIMDNNGVLHQIREGRFDFKYTN